MQNVDGYQSATDLFGNLRLLERYAPTGKVRTSERAELFRMFLNRLNPHRARIGLQPLTPSRLGLIFQGVPTSDLYALDSYCRHAKSYSAEFWFRTKPHNAPALSTKTLHFANAVQSQGHDAS